MAFEQMLTYSICPQCKGRKVVDVTLTTPDPDDSEPDVTEVTCPRCNGAGEVEEGKVDSTDLSDRLDDLEDKLDDILELLQP